MGKLVQADFGGGIWGDLDAPPGYVFDAINVIVDGAGLRLRGGVTSVSSDLATLVGLASWRIAGPNQTVAWTPTSIGAGQPGWVMVMSTASQPVVPWSRAVGFGGAMVLRTTDGTLWLYAGTSVEFSATETVTTAVGDRTVTGSGGNHFTTTLGGGMIAFDGDRPSVVQVVDSDTSLRSWFPWETTNAGVAIAFHPFVNFVPQSTSARPIGPVSAVGVAGEKLLLASGPRLWMTRGRDWLVNDDEFHDLGSNILGVAELGSTAALVFTERGASVVDNIAFDLTDAAGNPQQQLRLVSPNIVLWNESGIAAWDGRVVAPCLDDVYLFTTDSAPTVVSLGIRSRYRSYVSAGYRPGIAAVVRGHYVLPILDGSNNIIDMLVCRLDQPDSRGALRPAWTRFSQGALSRALAREVGSDGMVRMLGTAGSRLIDLTPTFTPGDASLDYGGQTPDIDVTTNDFQTGPGNRNTVTRLRLRYEMPASSTLTPSIVTGPAGAPVETALAGAGVQDGETGVSWRFVKRCERIRFRVRSSGSAATLRLRSLEVFTRDSYRP